MLLPPSEEEEDDEEEDDDGFRIERVKERVILALMAGARRGHAARDQDNLRRGKGTRGGDCAIHVGIARQEYRVRQNVQCDKGQVARSRFGIG